MAFCSFSQFSQWFRQEKKNVVCDETIFNRLLNFELRPQHCFSESSGSEYEGTVEPLNPNNNIVVGTM